MPITLGERRSIAALGESGYGVHGSGPDEMCRLAKRLIDGWDVVPVERPIWNPVGIVRPDLPVDQDDQR